MGVPVELKTTKDGIQYCVIKAKGLEVFKCDISNGDNGAKHWTYKTCYRLNINSFEEAEWAIVKLDRDENGNLPFGL